jgi:hypothetical protein
VTRRPDAAIRATADRCEQSRLSRIRVKWNQRKRRTRSVPLPRSLRGGCVSKTKNPAAPAVKRETEEDWGKHRWR